MKYSHKLSDAVHILVYIGICEGCDLSSATIAKSVESNPSLVRRLMSNLVKNNILITQPGISAPRLAREAEMITLLDVYQAVEESQSLLHVDEETNPNCVIGSNIQATLNVAYQKVQQAAEDEMQKITLRDLMTDLVARQDAIAGLSPASEKV